METNDENGTLMNADAADKDIDQVSTPEQPASPPISISGAPLPRLNGFRAFGVGLSRSLRYPQLLLVSYLVSLLSAGMLAFVPALMLTTPAHRIAIREAANGIDDWLVIELMESPLASGALGGPVEPRFPDWMNGWILAGLATWLILPVVVWLPASFVTGGALLTFVEGQKFSWRRFLWGCWRWFGAFLLLNALEGFVSQLLFGGLLTGAVIAGIAAGGWLNWVTLPLVALLAMLWLAAVEATRAMAVAGGTRNIFRAFGRAAAAIFRRPLQYFLLYGLAMLLLLLVHAIFRLGLMPVVPLAWWPVVFAATQAFILLRLWARLARWAGVAGIIGMTSDG